MIDIYSTITVELIKRLIELRGSKKEAELSEPEWKSLENAYMGHLEWRFKYPARVFGQQMVATWLITILVMALVISGLVFAFLQLRSALKLGDFSGLKTEIAIETAGKLSYE